MPQAILADLPDRGLRLMQPYANKVVDGEITMLLRTRGTKIRGKVLVLASKKPDKKLYPDGNIDATYPLNKAIGTVEIVDSIKATKKEIESGMVPGIEKDLIKRYPQHLLPKNEKLNVWILKNPEKFKIPKPYQCLPSLSILVSGVKLLEKEEMPEAEIEKTSIWDFGEADRSPAHDLVDFHGWYPPQIPRNCILRYSREGDTVLDCFVGSGTTLVECKRYNRKGIGIDINPRMIKITNEKLRLLFGGYEQIAKVGDARSFLQMPEFSGLAGKIDCIVTHPPYWKAIEYSKEHGEPLEGDLSLDKTLQDFLDDMRKVFKQMFQALKPGGYCCVTIGDIGEGGLLIPLGFYLTQLGLEEGFKMKDIAIWVLSGERSIRTSAFRLRFTEGQNSLLIKHNYVLIFQKPK